MTDKEGGLNMDDYISRQKLLNDLSKVVIRQNINKEFAVGDGITKTMRAYKNVIKNAPAADVVPVVHGRWISGKEIREYKCSNCEFCFWHRTNYCPECGAKMKMGGDSE